MQNCVLSSKKERERGGEAAVEEKGSLLSDCLGQFHQLVGIPDWHSPCLGFKQELRWLCLAPERQQMPFSECLLLRHFHIWRWMCHTVFLKSWDICKKKKNNTTTQKQQNNNKKRHIEKNSYSLIEWQMCEHPVGSHKGFCAIRIVQQSELFRIYIKGIKEAHGVFEAHYGRGKNRGLQGLYTWKPGVPLGVFSYSPSSNGTRQLLNCPTIPSVESYGSATSGNKPTKKLKSQPTF